MDPTAHGAQFDDSNSLFSKQQRNIQRRHVQDLELRFTKQIFHEFDADGSDSIDLGELRMVMEAMGHEMTQAQLKELLEQVDVNRSGDLSFSEFVQLIALWKAASQFKLFESDAPSIQDQRIQEALRPALLLSDSWYRVAWDATVYLVIVYSFFLISYILTTLYLDDDGISALLIEHTLEADMVATVIFAIDIFVGFLTAQQVSVDTNDRRLLDTFSSVAAHHLKSIDFYVDMFALLPLHRVTGDPSLQWLGFNTLFRFYKVPRLFRRSQRMMLTATYVYVHFYLIPLTHALVGALVFVHLLSCFWTLVQRAAVADGAPLTANITASSGGKGSNPTITYVASLYFILATVTTTGYGDVMILQNNGRIVATCILCVIGTLTTGIVIGNIVSTLSKTNIHTDRENKLVQTLAVLNYFSVPGPLANEILNFQNHVLLHDLGDSHRGLIRGLPAEMQKNISLFSRINLVSECSLFTKAHQGTKVALAEALVNAVFRPDENVVVQGQSGDCMYFVSYGVLGMKLSDNKEVFFQRGGFFGEVALLASGAERTATIKALTYCDLYLLSQETFRSILYRFPKFRVAVLEAAKQRKAHMANGFEKCGNFAKAKQIRAMVFIHEEESEAALLAGIAAAAAENESQLAKSGGASAAGGGGAGDIAAAAAHSSNNAAGQQESQLANHAAALSAERRKSSSVKSGRGDMGSPNSSSDGGADSPSGEHESPETDVRSHIKHCSTMLTEMHGMVHAMMHGFQYKLDRSSPGSRSDTNSRVSPVQALQQLQQQQQQQPSMLSPPPGTGLRI